MKWRIAVLITWTAGVSGLHFATGVGSQEQHAIHLLLRIAYLLPIIASAMWFQFRGSLISTILVITIFGLHMRITWEGQLSENMNQWATMVMFAVVGPATGLLARQVEEQRSRRHRLEAKRRRDLLVNALEGLSSALQWRDAYTQSHSENVARLSTEIASRLGICGEQLELVSQAARVHDIGKIGVRDDILFKPDQLNERERESIKKHPIVAADILRHIDGGEAIAEIVIAHHEQPDGEGYPYGKSQNEIPLEAAIVSVADVFSALTEDRPYQASQTIRQAAAIMGPLRGTKLNAQVLDVLMEMIEEKQLENKENH